MKTVIHCKTQNEWDILINQCSSSSRIYASSNKFTEHNSQYSEGIAISIENCSYCGLNYWADAGTLIISYDSWAKQNGFIRYTENKEPEDMTYLIKLLNNLNIK